MEREVITRTEMRRIRRMISPHQQQQAANGVQTQLLANPRVAGASLVGGYVAFDGELSVTETLRALRASGVRTAVAIVDGASMRFRLVDDATTWTTNRFGISEPAETSEPDVDPEDLDVVLVPAVIVDESANRIGMGGGFYDRAFADPTARPLLLATVHDEQVVPALHPEPHDVPMDAVVTPTRWIEAPDQRHRR